MNVKQRDGLKAKLAELDGLAEERAAVNQRIAAIDERSAVLAAQRDAIKERLLPLYDQPEHDRVERILAGLGVEMTPSDEAARRRSENQSLRDEQAQLERDIGLLGEEKTICEKKAEEIAANDEHARRAFLKQLGAALIDDYKAAANDLVFGIVFPILAINNGLDALGGRGQVIGVVNDLRISWWEGDPQRHRQLWPQHEVRMPDLSPFDHKAIIAGLIADLRKDAMGAG